MPDMSFRVTIIYNKVMKKIIIDGFPIKQHRLYRCWSGMMQRCYDKNDKSYLRYGGRNIKVCNRWHTSKNFINDMKNSYKEGLTLERINNNGDYKPSNCRWATKTEQARNRHNSRFITINKETKTLAEWIELSGVKKSTVSQRFHAYGWPIEKALGMV